MTEPFKNLKLLVIHHESDTHLDIKATTPKKQDTFHRLSVKISNKLGNAWAFFIALLVIVCWAVSGPLFNFSDTWQLVINTSTTIVTFLMVFVIQNTQNRDGRAMQLKLDELINTSQGARSKFVDIEELSDADLDQLEEQFKKIQEKIQSKSK
ncbi:MAG TPA: low affinity iron permease family protein [Candidatus Saccharibacteria bacterium]|jgi:low affinity Fe/Cu permease|nr:low affinity iron permease family protein [Candidatus Saccharibacteria bacterium]